MACQCFVGAVQGAATLASEAPIHSFRCPKPSEVGAHTSFRPTRRAEVFEWATDGDINNWNTTCLIGKRVQIKQFTIDVLSSLGAGRTGETFMAEVVEPRDRKGILMALKFRQGNAADHHWNRNAKEVEALVDAAMIYKKMASPEPVPHVVLMQAFGRLRVPRDPLLGCIPTCSYTSRYGKALLITLAAGSPLERTKFSNAEEKAACKQQLKEFAEGMYRKGLIHADLTVENIYWDSESQDATVIDFANAVDKNANNTVPTKIRALALKEDARKEMQFFLRTNGFADTT